MKSILLYHNSVPIQSEFILQNDFAAEINTARKSIKDYFIENNKEYLVQNSFTVKVEGFLVEGQSLSDRILFQVVLFDDKNERVPIDLLKIK
jgi:hypothetical protein